MKIRRAGVWQEEETTFVWQGMRLAQKKTGNGTHTYICDPDEGYSPLEMTDEKGLLRWSGKYGAWGRVTRQNARDIRENACRPFDQPLRYAGQYSDSETGLHYNIYRYYDPDSGRFTTQDPTGLAGGLNLYQYGVNPLGWIDPPGLYKKEDQRSSVKYHTFYEYTLVLSEYDLKESEDIKLGNQSVYERMQHDTAILYVCLMYLKQ